MINKKSLWFLTLFSLILVLSIYYVTMPSELLLTNKKEINSETNEKEEETPTVQIEESDLLAALRVEADSKMLEEIDDLKVVLTNDNTSTEEKNNALEKIKKLNDTRSEEENLEEKIKEEFNLNAFIKIDGDKIKVTIDKSEHSKELANKIIRSIQSNYEISKYITVKFQQ